MRCGPHHTGPTIPSPETRVRSPEELVKAPMWRILIGALVLLGACGGGDPAPSADPPVAPVPVAPAAPPAPVVPVIVNCTQPTACNEYVGLTLWSGADDAAREARGRSDCEQNGGVFGRGICRRADVTGACRRFAGSLGFFYSTDGLANIRANCMEPIVPGAAPGVWYDAAAAVAQMP